MPCSLRTSDREVSVNLPTATVSSIDRRNWQHSAAYLADHAEHAAWMMTPQPDLTRNAEPALALAAD
jgi:hypothetical protein